MHYFAQGSYQTGIGKDLSLAVSQPAVSRIISEVSHIFATHLLREYVKFPTTPEDIQTVKQG